MDSDTRFHSFLRSRGFDERDERQFLRRMFVDCWREPTFRGFWRLWNPLYGFLLFRLYLMFGGRKSPHVASFVVFALCGALLHDVPISLVLGRPLVATTIAFVCFWLMLALERGDASTTLSAVSRNIGRIVVGLGLGIAGQHALDAAAASLY